MPRRTDSRSRMIEAAFELFRKRSYHATAFSDVVQESGAPRGSIYFHFPGGKQQLAREVIALAIHLAIRGEIDYRIFVSSRGVDLGRQFRVLTGVVFTVR